MSIPLRVFGVTLIAFYLIGSKATKVGKSLKAKLEEGHQEAGHRTAWQVLCNSFTAAVACTLWATMFHAHSWHSKILSPFLLPYLGHPVLHTIISWCPLASEKEILRSRTLIFAFLGHFACCLGDTLASELGILSKSPPLLITTWRPVPPGTNGGVSLIGTSASIAGGAIIGATMALDLWAEKGMCLVTSWEYNVLNEAGRLVVYGAIAGALGSFVDSLLGATVQVTRYNPETKQILQDDSVPTKDVTIVSGWGILSNNQVNFISSLMIAVLFGVLGYRELI